MTIAICLLGIWLPTSSLASALGFTPLPYAYAAALLLILVAYLLVTQLAKGWIIRRYRLS